jgi:DNA-binding CsgD family transcriptional regulator
MQDLFNPGLVNTRVLSRMLDVVDFGVLLIVEGNHVAHANRTARSELDASHPLQLFGREIRARRPEDVAPLKEALAAAAHRCIQRLLILHDQAGREVCMSVVPMAEAGGPAFTMLAFERPQEPVSLTVETFARARKLTPAETDVLKRLARDESPSEIAGARGVKLSVVRTQIKEIREKTGCSDIRAVVHTMLRLPPMYTAWLQAA